MADGLRHVVHERLSAPFLLAPSGPSAWISWSRSEIVWSTDWGSAVRLIGMTAPSASRAPRPVDGVELDVAVVHQVGRHERGDGVGRDLDAAVDRHDDGHVGGVRHDGGHRADRDAEHVDVVADVDPGRLGEVGRHGVGRRGQQGPTAEGGDADDEERRQPRGGR